MANKKSNKKSLVAPKRSFPEPKAKTKRLSLERVRPAKRKRKKKRPVKKQNIFVRFFRWITRLIWIAFSRVAVVGAAVVGISTAYYYNQLPEAIELMDDRQRGSVTMLDRDAKVFAWRGDQFGGLVRPETVSPHLRNAVVATEDKRFYTHLGISPRGIAGAIRTNLREGRSALSGHGGSTITQQVAKSVYFIDLNSKERKIKEVPMSFAMELKYTKDEILAIYLNRPYLGAGSYGFEAASQRYFGKSARDVNPAESAMLAGLLKAPSSTAPTRNLARAQKRANLIVGLMEDQQYLTAGQAKQARDNPAILSKVAAEKAGGFFADWILEAAPDFLINGAREDVVINTTFDRRIQTAAEVALKDVFENQVKEGSKAQAAIVVMSRDGAVRAMVGGREIGLAGSFNRATQALRQTGSSFKPFVYAAALENGYNWNTMVVDEPISIPLRGQKPYEPVNYTKKFLGEINLTHAMKESVNTVSVSTSEALGRERVRALAADFGIANEIAKGPALALGASESTLLEMTGAYAGLLNGGVRARPYGMTSLTIQGEAEPLLGKSGGAGPRVINERAASELVYMMYQVIEDGTGKRAKLDGREAAGKTGTTQGARDAWFIGFTADYVVGVWMGYDDNSKLTGVTGGGLPAEIWKQVMLRVHEGMPATRLEMFRPEAELILQQIQDSQQVVEGIGDIGTVLENGLKDLAGQVQSDAKDLENEAQNILNSVLNNILSGGKQ